MLLSNLDLLATAPGGVARLRELILTLAVQGKLVPQDPADEPAGELLKKIRAEKDRLIAEGKIRRDKPLAAIAEEEKPFELPLGWEWVRFDELIHPLKPIAYGVLVPGPDVATGVPFVRIADLSLIDPPEKPEKTIGPEVDTQFQRTRLEGGEILMGVVGSIGKLGVAPKTWAGANIARAICRIVPADAGLHDFVLFLLQTKFMQDSFAGDTRTLAQPTLNVGLIRAALTPMPPPAEQSRIVTRVEELMRLCDALEAKGRLEAAQHAQLVSTLLGALTASATPEALADNWQRVAQHFDLLLDRPAAIDALEQTLLQLAVRGLLVPQDPTDEPASTLLQEIRAEKDRLIASGQIKRDKPLPPINEESLPCTLPSGWAWMRFSEVGDFRGGKTPSTQRSSYWHGEIPWITPKDMKQPLLSDSEDRVTLDALNDGLALIPSQSVLIVVRSGILRRRLPTAINLVETTINQDLKALVLVRPALAEYVQLLIQGFESFILENLTKVGTTVESVQFEAFTAQPFPFPPLAEQSRIVTRVTALRRLCADLRQRLAEREAVQARLAEALVQEVA